MPEEITLTVDDQQFSGWTDVSVNRSIESLTGSFSLSVTDSQEQRNNLEWALQTQAKAVIKVGGEPLINGYIYKVDPSIDSQSHTIRVSGRDKTSDLVDTSADQGGKKFTLKNTTLKKLAEILAEPYGIAVVVASGTNANETFSISFNTSESPFEILDKRAKEFGILLLSDRLGRLVLANAGSERASDSLIMGTNILSGSSSFDYTNRFSEYKVFGQSSGSSDWGGNINIQAKAEDPNVNRFRPLIIQAEGKMNRSRAQQRSNWEANVRAARSQMVTLTVQDFVQGNGDLWDINQLVSVFAPVLYINPATELLITSTEYIINASGSFTRISLKRADAYQAIPPKKVKSQNKLGW